LCLCILSCLVALPRDGLMVAFRGPGVVEEVAERAVLDRRFVKGERANAKEMTSFGWGGDSRIVVT
jgi:hypothetical protein